MTLPRQLAAALRAAVAVLAVCSGARPVHAQLVPDAAWRQIQTRHFNIIYEAGLDSIARRAAARAELEHAALSARLARAPAGRIDIVLADNTDITNGYATPFPANRIVIWVRPPVDELGLQYYHDWIDLVVAHELTHTFHINQAGTVGRALRTVFGRVPFAWPFFPVIGVPRWNTEGIATLVESEHTGAGRVYGSYHDMIVRTAILEDAFPSIDRLSGESPLWPGGNGAYVFGSLFMEHIAREHGQDAHARLIAKTRGSVLPPPWRLDGVAKSALGTSFRDLYAEWQSELTRRHTMLAAELQAAGVTEGERITTHGRWAVHARLSPDARKLAYAAENGRSVSATRVIDLSDGSDLHVRRNGIGPLAWLPDGSGFITAQYEFNSRYEIYSDLYLVQHGHETQLTSGARAEAPDVSADGRVVFVRTGRGTNQLVLRDSARGSDHTLIEASPDVHWTLPRFAPDGARIAVQRWTREHGHDITVIGIDGGVLAEIRTGGTDAAPAWSPDGRFVIFTSDRTGISNLYAYEVATSELRQVTNVLTGVFYPDVSGNGAWIYYSSYHADGFHIERIPYDPAAWREPMPAVAPADAHADPPSLAPAPAQHLSVSEPRGYAAVASARPRYWLPVIWEDTAIGTFVGAETSGSDAIGRHAYAVALANDFQSGRTAGFLTYTYAGLGQPVLAFSAVRDWDYTGRVALRDEAGEITDVFGSYEREDRISLTTAFSRYRWRQTRTLMLGAEGVSFKRALLGPARFRDPEDRLLGVLAGIAFSSARMPALAISPEAGVRGSVFMRRRWELAPATTDRSYTELSGAGAAYLGMGGSRFAHEVFALRASALHRTAFGRGPTDVGGVVDFLPVRGFSKHARIGFTAWTASAEYRMPLALVARGYKLLPLFVDRIGAAFFADAGNATCSPEQRTFYLGCPGNEGRAADVLVSAGFELRANVSVLVFAPGWMRGGIAFPLRGGERDAKVYLTVAPSF